MFFFEFYFYVHCKFQLLHQSNRKEIYMGQKHIQYLTMLGALCKYISMFQVSAYQIRPLSMVRRSFAAKVSILPDGPDLVEKHKAHMFLALRHAQYAQRNKEVPVGAVIVGKKFKVMICCGL